MSANNGLSCLIIGCGNIAGGYDADRSAPQRPPLTHAGAYLRNGGFVLTAGVEPDTKTREAFLHRWGIARGFGSMAELSRELETIDVVSICSPTPSHRADIEVSEVELPPEFNESHQIHATIYEKSLAYYFEQEAKNVSEISPIMQNMIQAGSLIANDDYLRALERQEALIRLADDTFREFDVCVSLSTAGSAPLRDKVESPDPSLMWTLAHVPTVSVPIFRSPEGLPFGLQVLGRKYNDFLLLQFLEWLLSEELIPASPTRAPITKRPAA